MLKKSKLNQDHNGTDLNPELINWVLMECAVCKKEEEYTAIYEKVDPVLAGIIF